MGPDPIPQRPQRSLLAVPATNARFLEKAAQSAADSVFIDLEDAVVPELKLEARARAIEALGALDWGPRLVAVRVNGLETSWGARDLLEIAESCPRLDQVILPKCETPGDVHAAAALLRSNPRIRIAPLIETAKGVANVEAIAAASPRLAAMIFGSGDYQLDMGIIPAESVIPAASPEAIGRDPISFPFAMARIANAARAYGLAPLDGPYFDIANADGLRDACKRAAALGFEGKMAIHPSQVAIANEMFSPSAAQVAWAREVLEAMAQAGEQGRGAVKTKDGKMIDLVHIKIARKVLERAERIAVGTVR